MAIFAMAMPILPGKKQKWLDKMEELNHEPMRSGFRASREAAGVHERSFLQETPHGDFVILTFEGDDPAAGFGKIMASMPPDFAEFAKDVHGLEAGSPPPTITLVFDSRG